MSPTSASDLTPSFRPPGGTERGVVALIAAIVLLSCTAQEPKARSGEEIQREIQRILAVDDDLDRVHALSGLLRELPPTAAPEVVAGFDSSFLDRGDIELVLLAHWWTPHDPEAVQAWATSNWRAEHPRVEYAVMRATARKSPKTAVALYYGKHRDPRTYGAVLEALVVGWYESGAEGLLTFIDQLPSTEVRQQAVGTLARVRVLDIGAEAATAWADELVRTLASTDLSALILYRVANSAAEHDPDVAASWAKQRIEGGESTRLLPRVAGRWSKREPVAALLWLSEFEESNDQQFAVRKSFTNFRMTDPLGADAWLADQGEAVNGWLAPALEYKIQTVTDRAYAAPERRPGIDWEGTLGEAIGINDEGRRWGTVSHVARLWLLEDRPAAESWMEANNMPQFYRDKVDSPLPAGYRRKLERLSGI